MSSRYELPFSLSYVPDWTYIEAFRELFQNALDNEIMNPDNKMLFDFDNKDGILRVCNKTSSLELDSLLLGSTTKANNEDTIGIHGEGYKLAFLVLLRENKSITVYNYGKREIWTVKLVKSRRYNNQMVPVITVEKEAFWKHIPDNDLTIEVGGITQEEYDCIVSKNLNLQKDVERYESYGYGSILTSEKEQGNIYVKGLWVCNTKEVKYGYDFEPKLISLDRDRKLVKTFDIVWNASCMWKSQIEEGKRKELIASMIEDGTPDVRYFSSIDYGKSSEMGDLLAHRFKERHGDNAVPVKDNDELESVRIMGKKPVIVNCEVANYISKSTSNEVEIPVLKEKTSVKLENIILKIENKLTDEELEELRSIVEEIRNLE